MRWRNHRGEFQVDQTINQPVSHLFAETMIKMFTGKNGLRRGFPKKEDKNKWPEIRLTANSLGTSLMIMGQAKILELQGSKGPALAKRMVLIGKEKKIH